jgi:hypothetical protein
VLPPWIIPTGINYLRTDFTLQFFSGDFTFLAIQIHWLHEGLGSNFSVYQEYCEDCHTHPITCASAVHALIP